MRWFQLSAASVAIVACAAANPTVTINQGVVVGRATPVASGSATSTVYNYLGIPFAAVPTGSLRFAPPATPVTLSKPLQATAFPPACPQQFQGGIVNSNFTRAVFNNPGGPPPQESEDCLYLNVFAPRDASLKNKKAVLFWIYGGNLQFGTGSLGFYNGSSFAGFQDLVVVTINYRTNMFGFSNSPEIPNGQQNSGFLDQRAALQWVQNNIDQFGGDPNKVTIFGESAGGYSVKQLLAQPPFPLPFRAAIMESEAAAVLGNGLESYEQVVNQFGCTTAVSQLDCLRKVPAIDIVNYISTQSVNFPPAQDSSTQVGDVRGSLLSHRWANVPFLIGTNADEGNVFAAAFGLESTSNTSSSKSATAAIDPLIAEYIPDPAQRAAIISAFMAQDTSPQKDVFLIASRIITDLIFACPAGLLSNNARLVGYTDVWRYYYNATFPNLSIFPNAGAYHSSEIPQVFGTYASVKGLGPATPEQAGLSKYMQTAWAKFAKDPHNGPGWAALGSGPNDVADLGGINKTGATLVPQSVPDEFCAIYDPVLAVIGY